MNERFRDFIETLAGEPTKKSKELKDSPREKEEKLHEEEGTAEFAFLRDREPLLPEDPKSGIIIGQLTPKTIEAAKKLAAAKIRLLKESDPSLALKKKLPEKEELYRTFDQKAGSTDSSDLCARDDLIRFACYSGPEVSVVEAQGIGCDELVPFRTASFLDQRNFLRMELIDYPEALRQIREQIEEMIAGAKEGEIRDIVSQKLENVAAKAKGFGTAALEAGELEASIECLDIAGILKDPAIQEKLSEKLRVLAESGEEGRDRAIRMAKRIKKILKPEAQPEK